MERISNKGDRRPRREDRPKFVNGTSSCINMVASEADGVYACLNKMSEQSERYKLYVGKIGGNETVTVNLEPYLITSPRMLLDELTKELFLDSSGERTFGLLTLTWPDMKFVSHFEQQGIKKLGMFLLYPFIPGPEPGQIIIEVMEELSTFNGIGKVLLMTN